MIRTTATIKNSMAGMLYQITYVILGFVSRVIFVRILGLEYYGLNGLFTSILTMLSMADLGISWSISYNLYQPLAENNQKYVAALMNLFRKVYYCIAGFIILVGLALIPFLGYIAKTDLDMHYVSLIFILFAFENSMSYICSYKAILLTADQKNYVSTLYETGINVVLMILRICVLIFTKNYILYLVTGITIRIIGNIIRSRGIDRYYPFLKEMKKEKLYKQERDKVYQDTKNVAVHKLCDTSVNSTDNILISIFCGVKAVGLYSNYILIFNIVNGMAGQFINSYQASLGNLYAMEGETRIYDIFEKSTFLSFLISAFCACSLYGLIQPFITFWMGSSAVIADYSIEVVILNFILLILTDPLNKVVNAAGLFKRDKCYAFMDMVVNLVSSVILGAVIGMKGIFIGTCLGLVCCSFFRSRYLFHEFFNMQYRKYLLKMSEYALLIIVEVAMVLYIFRIIPSINATTLFITKMAICIFVPNGINFALFHNTPELQYYITISIKIL